MKKKDREYPKLTGVNVRRTPRGVVVFELDYVADPAKRDPQWAARMRSVMSEKQFSREFLRDWASAAGDSFYPEFGAQAWKYILSSPALLTDSPVYRGWDFGFRHAACVWFQYSPASHRVWVLRELMPQNMDTYDTRDLVLYLSGQRPIEHLEKRPRAMAWLKKIQDDPKLPTPPWFDSTPSSPIRFIDYAGHEATKRSAQVEGDKKERTDKDILAAEGINVEAHFVNVSAREAVMRHLLHTRPDGYPGILFDPACPILIEGMNGGIAYPKETKQNPDPTEPQKDGYYEHLHDGLGYGLVNVVPYVEPKEPPRIVEYLNRRPVPQDPVESLGWKEVINPDW